MRIAYKYISMLTEDHYHIFKKLLDLNARTNIVSDRGKTVFDIAHDKKIHDLQNYWKSTVINSFWLPNFTIHLFFLNLDSFQLSL